MFFFGSSGSLEEHINSLGKLNNQKCSKYDVTKMAATSLKRFPHYILASAKFYILLPVCVQRKCFMSFGSTGSVEEHIKCLEKMNNRNSLNMTSQKMAANGQKRLPHYILASAKFHILLPVYVKKETFDVFW